MLLTSSVAPENSKLHVINFVPLLDFNKLYEGARVTWMVTIVQSEVLQILKMGCIRFLEDTISWKAVAMLSRGV